MIVRLAEKGDLTTVFSLYKEAVGRDGCAWDEEYPGEFWLGKDFETGNLYVLADEKNAPVGAASVVYENELNDQADWNEKENAREIARVVIGKAHAGQGLAAFMLEKLFDRLKDRQHRYFDCPKCHQMVRVPRGKGKISITCPRCREKFVKKT